MRKTKFRLIAYSLLVFMAFAFNSEAAELILRVSSSDDAVNGYQSGDIVAAFNDKRIESVHAQNILSTYLRANPSRNTPRAEGTFFQKSFEHVREFKFERLTRNSIRRTNLITREVDTLSNVPNADGEYMDVPLYISRRLASPKHQIFVDGDGDEFWYGGDTSSIQTSIDSVWVEIEAATIHNKSDDTLWPLGLEETRRFRSVLVNDFSDSVANALVASGSGRRRNKRVDFVNLAGLTSQNRIDIADPTFEFDLRSFGEFDRDTIVENT